MLESTYDKSVQVILTSNEFYGKPGLCSEALISALKAYDRDSLMIVFSKWQILLMQKHSNNPYRQLKIARLFINRSQYKRLRNNIKQKPRVILCKDVIVCLMKLNLQHNNVGGNALKVTSDSRGLFKIILSMNSLYAQEVMPNVIDRQEYRTEILEEHRYAMAKQLLGISSSEVLHEIYRGKRINEHLNLTHPIFNEKFKLITGVDVDEYYEIIFLMLFDWGLPLKSAVSDIVFKNLGNYFSNTTINEDVARRVIGLHSLKPDEFNELHDKYTLDGNLNSIDDQWNFITFFNRQLLELENGYICLSPDALRMQLSQGPYNLVRQQLKIDNDIQSTHDLPNWWGRAYENYVLERLRLAFGEKMTATNILLNNGNESIDAVVEFDDTVLLIEIKYPHWKFSTRVNPTRENMVEHVKKFVDKKKGLGQIKKFLALKESNGLQQTFDFKGKLIIPMLILGEDFPFDPLDRQIITDYAVENNLIPEGDNILPYILVSTNEVEIMEGFSEQYGVDVLKSYIGLYSSNFLLTDGIGLLDKPTTFLNILTTNRIPVQNSTSLNNSLDLLFENLSIKFPKK